MGFGAVEVMVVRPGGVGELATARLMFTSAAASKYYYIIIVQRYLYTHTLHYTQLYTTVVIIKLYYIIVYAYARGITVVVYTTICVFVIPVGSGTRV